MEYKELKFKTNLNCGACVSKVKPALDAAANIQEWHVDTTNADKILTVSSAGISQEEVISLIKAKGFQIETNQD